MGGQRFYSAYGVRSFTCYSQEITSFNKNSQESTKIYKTCGLLVNTCEIILVSCKPRNSASVTDIEKKVYNRMT
jgi:hypothetical protein